MKKTAARSVPGWHAAPALLVAYAGGRSGPADSWSLEAHLIDCTQCRAALALVLDPDDTAFLLAQRDRLLTSLPPQASSYRKVRRTHRPYRSLHWLTRPSALLVVLVAVAAATVLDLIAPASWPALWLLAPVVPALGVAAAAWGEDDPSREAVLATPSSGLRLILWRTCIVIGAALPLTALAGLLVPSTGLEFRWLLPSLATSIASLALGTVLALDRAAAVVAGAWVLFVVGPSIRLLEASVIVPPALTGQAQLGWCLLILAALLLLVVRRRSFDHLSGRASR